jgi:hypothetical protein
MALAISAMSSCRLLIVLKRCRQEWLGESRLSVRPRRRTHRPITFVPLPPLFPNTSGGRVGNNGLGAKLDTNCKNPASITAGCRGTTRSEPSVLSEHFFRRSRQALSSENHLRAARTAACIDRPTNFGGQPLKCPRAHPLRLAAIAMPGSQPRRARSLSALLRGRTHTRARWRRRADSSADRRRCRRRRGSPHAAHSRPSGR